MSQPASQSPSFVDRIRMGLAATASAEASPVDRKDKATKRSSNSYTSEEWRPQRPVFHVRGRQVTLADTLHYFNRKGIKDPLSLLETQFNGLGELSCAGDPDARTPLSFDDDAQDVPQDGPNYELPRSAPEMDGRNKSTLSFAPKPSDVAEKLLASLQQALDLPHLPPMPPFRTLAVKSTLVQRPDLMQGDQRYLDLIFQNMQKHYMHLFHRPKLVNAQDHRGMDRHFRRRSCQSLLLFNVPWLFISVEEQKTSSL